MQSFKDFLNRNKWAILFVLSAAVLVALVFLLKWWSFLVIPLLALAVFFGHLLDQGGADSVKRFFDRLFSKED